MSQGLLIVAISALSIFFLAFLILGLISFRFNKERKRFDFLVDFPIDLYPGHNLYGYLSRIAFLGFEIAPCLIVSSLLGIDGLKGLESMFVFLIATSFLHAGGFMILVFVSPSNEKVHFTVALTTFFLGALNAFFSGLIFFQLRTEFPLLSLIACLLFWLLALAYLGLAINPKLYSWAKMKVVEDVGGSYLEKPRPFILAFTEWLVIFLDLLSFLALFGCSLALSILL